MTEDNTERAHRAAAAIIGYFNARDPNDPDLPKSIEQINHTTLADFLADVQHLCDCNDLDIYVALSRSFEHYLEERE